MRACSCCAASRASFPVIMHRIPQDLSYMLYVLGDYLGLAENERRIKLVKQVNGKEMSWTLGRHLPSASHCFPRPVRCCSLVQRQRPRLPCSDLHSTQARDMARRAQALLYGCSTSPASTRSSEREAAGHEVWRA